ncbi:MAG: energy transducer TonB [Methylohalobius sp. ZOD2]|nr:energy transducer TonB [Methylothermaceae bacterium]
MTQGTFGSPSDRMLVAVLVALVVHAGLIFGIHFRMPDIPKIERTLDIELISQPDTKRPDKADYLAQSDSEGEGKPPAKQSRPVQPSQFRQPVEATTSSRRDPPPQPSGQPAEEKHHTNPGDEPAEADLQNNPHLTQAQADAALPSDGQSTETASEPHLDRRLLARQISELGVAATQPVRYSPNERVVPIRELISAHKYVATAYERAWQEKVERIGNLNYPDEARRKGLSGSLVVSVWVNREGKMEKIKILRSSGHRVLDDAAIRIMRLAAPFSPFPDELAAQADEIVITRTWKFYNEAGLAMDR